MVRDEARDDDIPAAAGEIGIIARHPADRQSRWGVQPRRALAARVEIDPYQLGRDPAPRGPARDPAQHVAVAEADIEHPPPRPPKGREAEQAERRSRSEE